MNEVDDEGLTDCTEMDPLAAFFPRRRRGVLVTSAAVAALGLSLGGATVAGAATTSTAPTAPSGASGASGLSGTGSRPPLGGSPPTAMGTVASVGAGTFTITTRDNTRVTVNVSSSTTYLDRGVTSPTIANVTVGEHVAVFGTDTSDVVSATRVAIGDPGGGTGPGPGGSGGGGRGGPGGPGGPGGRSGKGGGPPVGASSSSARASGSASSSTSS